MSRILFVSANDWEPWGGSEELWCAAAKQLRERGATVTVSVKWFGQEVPQIAELAAAGCRVHYRRRPFRQPARHLALQRALSLARLHYLRDQDLVVISQGLNTDGLPWMMACRRHRLRYAVITQSAAESWWPYDREAEPLAAAYTGAEKCFFVCHANLELTQKQIATTIARAAVVRNPFNVPYSEPIPWPQIDESTDLRLACVGRLDPRGKGQDLIFDVLRSGRWRERRITVSLFGKGPAERSLRRLVELYELPSVRFAGFTSDVADIWRTHHGLLLPSRYEGLPLVLVEAMLAGRPVIVTDVAGNAEVVTDGETGFLAAAATSDRLAEAMERAWQCRSQLREMGAHAARAIRRLVPRDPAAVFADELEMIAKRS